MQSAATPSQRIAESSLKVYLWVFCLLSLAGWLPEVAGRLGCPWVSADYSALLHPSDTFSNSGDFEDLTDFAHRMQHISGVSLAGVRGPFPYPPAAAWVFAFFLRCFTSPIAAYLIAFAAAVLAGAWILWRSIGLNETGSLQTTRLARIAAALTLLLGSSVLFTAARANIEWVNCALTCAALVAFARTRFRITAILLGLAVAIKPFPILFFILLLWRRRYLDAVLGILAAAAVSLASLVALGPSIGAAAHGIAAGWSEYYAQYVLVVRTAQEFRFNHSLLDAIKVPIWFIFDHQAYDPRQMTAAVPGIRLWERLDLWAHALAAFSLAAAAWIYWRFRRMPALNGILAITVAELLLPYSAAEYTLLLLYVPWALLIVTIARDVPANRLRVTRSQLGNLLVPCAILFTPLSFMNCLSGITKTLLLLYLLLQTCRIPLPSSLFHELPTASAT